MDYFINTPATPKLTRNQMDVINETYPNIQFVNAEKVSDIKGCQEIGTLVFYSIDCLVKIEPYDFIGLLTLLNKEGISVNFINTPNFNSESLKAVSEDNHIEIESLIKILYESHVIASIELAKLSSSIKQNAKKHGVTYSRKKPYIIFKKSQDVIEFIKENSKLFGGVLDDKECIEILGCSRNTFYKYKKMLKEEKRPS